jgi:hypothetical protein
MRMYVYHLISMYISTNIPISPRGVAGEEAEGDGGGVIPKAAHQLELHVHHPEPEQLVLLFL